MGTRQPTDSQHIKGSRWVNLLLLEGASAAKHSNAGSIPVVGFGQAPPPPRLPLQGAAAAAAALALLALLGPVAAACRPRNVRIRHSQNLPAERCQVTASQLQAVRRRI